MNEYLDIEQLKSDFLSGDPELARSASDQLATKAGDDGRDFLISVLSSSDSRIRDWAALGIEKSKDQRALVPLLRAILNPENKFHSGTLLFTLEALDCTAHLQEVFDILFYQSYEAKMTAVGILSEQSFLVEPDLIQSIKGKWDIILLDPSQCPDFEESRDDIQDVVDHYVQMVAAK